MSWWNRIMRRGDREESAPDTEAVPEAPCLHLTLVPRWDSAEDIGHDDRAIGFDCEMCRESFTPDEATQLRATEGERLRSELS